MFCSKCGARNDDGAAFCSACGAPLGQPGSVSKNPATDFTSNPLVAKLISRLKKFFSKNYASGVADAAKSTTAEGLILLGIYVIVFAFAVPVIIKELLGEAGKYVPFGPLFGVSILVGAVVALMYYLAVLVTFRATKHPEVTSLTVFNIVGYAFLPITTVLLADMLLGLILPWLCGITIFAATVLRLLMLYVGIQRAAKFEKSPMLVFTLFLTLFELIAIIIAAIFYGIAVAGAAVKTASGFVGRGGIDISKLF